MIDKHSVNLYKLLEMIGDVRMETADNVLLTKVTYNKDYNRYTFYTVTALNRYEHMVTIEPEVLNSITKTAKLSSLENIKVSCNCADYKYRFEAANHNIGLSDIIYSNGQLPVETNPGLIPGICKHITKCVIFLLQRDL